MRAQGTYEETMIVVCADHGELFGEHDLYGHEFNVYDPLINVPLLIKHPELDADRREDQVELLDLYHTVLDHCGADAADATQPLDPTRSLLSDRYREFENGPDHPERVAVDPEYAFVEYYRPVVELKQLENKAAAAGIELDEDSRFYSRMRAARRPDGKYVRNERISDECYALDADPAETENLVGSGEQLVETVETTLSTFEDRVGGEWKDRDGDGDALEDMGEDAKNRLEDLGYID